MGDGEIIGMLGTIDVEKCGVVGIFWYGIVGSRNVGRFFEWQFFNQKFVVIHGFLELFGDVLDMKGSNRVECKKKEVAGWQEGAWHALSILRCFHPLYTSIRDRTLAQPSFFSSVDQAEPDELWLVALEKTSVLRLGKRKTHRKQTVGVGVKVEDSGEIVGIWWCLVMFVMFFVVNPWVGLNL